jgi:hypothetical protein
MIEGLEPVVVLRLLWHTHPMVPASAAIHLLQPLVALLEVAIPPAPAIHQRAVGAVRKYHGLVVGDAASADTLYHFQK